MERNLQKNATRRDVAECAGVSVATVSYVLNNRPGINLRQETRERVLEAARRLNYRPSYIGTALTQRRSFNIGVLFRSLHHLHYHYYREILIGAGTAMEEENYHMLLFFRNYEQQLVESLRSGRADGVFVIQSDDENHQMVELAENRIPMVSVNSPAPKNSPETTSEVLPDTLQMMRDAIGGFVRNGRKRILLVNMETPANMALNRTFSLVCGEYASDGVEGIFHKRPSLEEWGKSFMEMASFGQMPDAMFINRFEYAEAACKSLFQLGIIPGKDILIASCSPDGTPTACSYAMTLYLHDGAAIGQVAWEQMKKLLSREASPMETRLVPYRKLVFP